MQTVQVESVELAQSLMGDLHEEMLFQIGSSPRALEASVAESGVCGAHYASCSCTVQPASLKLLRWGQGLGTKTLLLMLGAPCLVQLRRAPNTPRAAALGGCALPCGTVRLAQDMKLLTPTICLARRSIP